MPVGVVIAAVAVAVVPIIVAIVAALIITPVIVTAVLLVKAGGRPDILLDLLVGFIGVCPLFGHAQQVLDRLGPLAELFCPESIMEMETPDEGRGGYIVVDVGDVDTRLRNKTNVVMHRLVRVVPKFL